MCENKKHITFCTCVEKASDNRFEAIIASFKILGNKEEYLKTNYTWSLERVIRKYSLEERTMIVGELGMPSKMLDTELTAAFVVNELNKKVEFDFDYAPQDGDEITIGLDYRYKEIENHARPSLPSPMNFVYENEEWYFGYVNHFEYQKRTINKGKIELHHD